MLVVGAASRDLAADDPRGWRLGGAVTYAALTLARLGLHVRALVGVDAIAAEAQELDLLRAAGAEVVQARLDRGPVFQNIESASGRVQMCVSESDRIPVAVLPPAWVRAEAAGPEPARGQDPTAGREPAWMLVPVADELGPEWATEPGAVAFVAVGWQGMLRTLVAGEMVRRRAPQRNELVARANLIGLSRDDLAPATSPSDLLRLIGTHAELVVTEGDRGGSISGPATGDDRRRSTRRYPALRSDELVDPTGAGDVFLAAIVAARLDPSLEAEPTGRDSDIRFAAATASLAIERPGLAGVPELDAVLRRMRRRSTRVASA